MLVVRVAGDENIVLRLRAELNSYRFRVVELPPAKRAEALSQLAEERDAQAALRARPDAMAVEVWVRASSAGARTSEELVSAGPGRDPELLAVRVTEAMRARGLVLPPPMGSSGAAGSGKRANLPADGEVAALEPSAAVPTVAIEDVEPAQPTTAPPAIARPVTPAPEPKRSASDTERKRESDRTAEPARKPESERKPDPERTSASERQRKPGRIPEPERTPEVERKLEPERTPEPQRKREPEHKSGTKSKPAQGPEREGEGPATEWNPPRSALLYVEVGPTAVLSPGTNRLGPALDAFVSVKFRPYQTSSISLVGLIPLLSTDFTTNDGTPIEVKTFGIGGFGDLHLPLGRVELNVGIGGMAMLSSILVADDSAAGPVYQTDRSLTRLGTLLGRMGASLALTPDLRIAASIMVGLSVNDLRLQFLNPQGNTITHEVHWGTPLMLGTLSLELALPWDR